MQIMIYDPKGMQRTYDAEMVRAFCEATGDKNAGVIHPPIVPGMEILSDALGLHGGLANRRIQATFKHPLRVDSPVAYVPQENNDGLVVRVELQGGNANEIAVQSFDGANLDLAQEPVYERKMETGDITRLLASQPLANAQRECGIGYMSEALFELLHGKGLQLTEGIVPFYVGFELDVGDVIPKAGDSIAFYDLGSCAKNTRARVDMAATVGDTPFYRFQARIMMAPKEKIIGSEPSVQ